MFTERTSVGLDVHARSVAAAAIDGVTGELRQTRLTPSHEQIIDWLRDLPGPVAVAYEAGPTGFGLSRALNGAGIRCVVVAPITALAVPTLRHASARGVRLGEQRLAMVVRAVRGGFSVAELVAQEAAAGSRPPVGWGGVIGATGGGWWPRASGGCAGGGR